MSRLRELPAIFSLAELAAREALDREVAMVYVSRWHAAKHLAPTGPRTGIYFNLVADPAGPAARLSEALLKTHARAVLLDRGSDGPQDIAVPLVGRQRTTREVYGFAVHLRPSPWFDLVNPVVRQEQGLPCLPRAWAAADAKIFEALTVRIRPEEKPEFDRAASLLLTIRP